MSEKRGVDLLFQKSMRKRAIGNCEKEEALGLSNPVVGNTPSQPAIMGTNGVCMGRGNQGLPALPRRRACRSHLSGGPRSATRPGFIRGAFDVILCAAKPVAYDFDARGNPRQSRTPVDPPVVIWAHGLPWFAVYKGSYILCGSYKGAMGYLLSGARQQQAGHWFDVGTVLAPSAVVASLKSDPLTQTQFTLEKDSSAEYDDNSTGLVSLGRKNGVYVRMGHRSNHCQRCRRPHRVQAKPEASAFGNRAPSSCEHQKLWVKRLKAFREYTPGNDPTVPFTGTKIIRLFDSIINNVPLPFDYLDLSNEASVVGKIQPKVHGDPVPSVKTIVHAYGTIINYAVSLLRRKDQYAYGLTSGAP